MLEREYTDLHFEEGDARFAQRDTGAAGHRVFYMQNTSGADANAAGDSLCLLIE
jgi:hypothetical protein